MNSSCSCCLLSLSLQIINSHRNKENFTLGIKRGIIYKAEVKTLKLPHCIL